MNREMVAVSNQRKLHSAKAYINQIVEDAMIGAYTSFSDCVKYCYILKGAKENLKGKENADLRGKVRKAINTLNNAMAKKK